MNVFGKVAKGVGGVMFGAGGGGGGQAGAMSERKESRSSSPFPPCK